MFGRKPRIMYVPAGEDPKQARISYFQSLKRKSSGGGEMLPLLLAGLAFVALVGIGLWWFFGRGEKTVLAVKPSPETGIEVKHTPAPTATATLAPSPAASLLLPSSSLTATTNFIIETPPPTPIPDIPEIAPLGAGAVTVFGSIAFQGGCSVTNLAFVASGNIYYLLVTGDIQFPEGNPESQMAMIRGYTSEYKDCDAPMLTVSSIKWLKVTEEAQTKQSRGVGAVVTAHGTPATPLPTAMPTNTAIPTATATPRPPATPLPTAIPTNTPTATPAPVSLTGLVLLSDGCSLTNWLINATGEGYYLIMPQSLSIDFDPRAGREAIISGTNSRACDGRAIIVSSVIWLSTPTPTATLTPTVTNTPTNTPTATMTATVGAPTETPAIPTETPVMANTATPTATTPADEPSSEPTPVPLD